MLCPYLLISINELLISIISFNDINKYGLNVKTAAHTLLYVVLVESEEFLRQTFDLIYGLRMSNLPRKQNLERSSAYADG